MVTRGLWNLHVDGKWYRWFHPPRGVSSSPDSRATLTTFRILTSDSSKLKWESVPFPTPLHFQLDYVYTIDEDAGHFTVTEWRGIDEVPTRINRRMTLASIRETSLPAIDTLLSDVVEVPKKYTSLDGEDNEVSVQHALRLLEIKPDMPARLNELQFQFFTDFVFTWRFYIDDTFTWDHTSSVFSALAIGLLRIAAWDFEVRNTDTEDLPILFSSLPRWKAPRDRVFWFHRYLILCCNTDQISNAVAINAKHLVSQCINHKGPVHGIAISIRNIALFEIRNGKILRSTSIPLVTNISALHCSPGFRILAYILTSSRLKGPSAKSGEHWGTALPTEIFEMILEASEPSDLVSMAQASDSVEEWYYSSIPQIPGLIPRDFFMSIPCCGRRDTSNPHGAYCSVCYAWSHMECTGLSATMFSDTDHFTCSSCRESVPCASLDTGGIHHSYRKKRERNARSVIHEGKNKEFWLRVNTPTSRQPELRFIRNLAPPPPQSVDYTIFFSGVFSGLAYGFDD
ncbi:unnamed protein product [Penicillium olsonii]|nr:unnamed protein product [Penicillium olsonii]